MTPTPTTVRRPPRPPSPVSMAQSWNQHTLNLPDSEAGYRPFGSLGSSSSLLSVDVDNNYPPYVDIEELRNTSVFNILERNNEHNGFLYKRAQEKVTDTITESVSSVISTSIFGKWQLRYVVMYREYVLYYKDDHSTRPKGVFSLKGYNRVVRAEDMTSANQKWAFKIIGLRSEDRTWYFGAPSEREMRLWMAFFKVAMEKAIHGKARDKSLRILQDLKYNQTKFVQQSQQGSELHDPTAFFEPSIYEDIEEPLEEEDYLPPKPSMLSSSIMLPVLPRKAPYSVEPSRAGVALPVVPTRPPELARRESSLSTTSMESGDYIKPPDADASQVDAFRNNYPSQRNPNAERSPFRPLPRHNIEEESPQMSEQRVGPDGNSFRKKVVPEQPQPNLREVRDFRSNLKPVIPTKPKPDPKPKPALKPAVPYKPKPATRKDILPPSIQYNSSDKKAAERLLISHSVDGMYLLRLSSEAGKQVLMVFHRHLGACKHYKVFGDQTSSFSLDTDPHFISMQQLIFYYMENSLPNTSVKLTEPYPG